MIELKELLGRFNKYFYSEDGKREAVKNAIFETTAIKIEPREIKIANNTIYLNTKPIYKNEIFLKQNEIFSKLRKILGNKTPQRIS